VVRRAAVRKRRKKIVYHIGALMKGNWFREASEIAAREI